MHSTGNYTQYLDIAYTGKSCGRTQFESWAGKIPWRRDKLPTPVCLGFPSGSDGKESACNVEDLGLILSWKDPLEKGIATHSSILAWPAEFHGLYRPLGCKELDTTEQLSLTHICVCVCVCAYMCV